MSDFRRSLLLISLVLMSSSGAYANVVLSPLITDHMVLQRGVPIHIWGKAAPAETISLTRSKGYTVLNIIPCLEMRRVVVNVGDRLIDHRKLSTSIRSLPAWPCCMHNTRRPSG